MHRGNVLGSEILAKDLKNVENEEAEVDKRDIIQRAREEYGRYFGICGSYHHLKACLCKYCSVYPGGSGMFCARGSAVKAKEKKEGCLCETCELFKKFRLEGGYFCQLEEKGEVFEIKHVHPNICEDFQTSAGTIRVCVLGEQNIHSNK